MRLQPAGLFGRERGVSTGAGRRAHSERSSVPGAGRRRPSPSPRQRRVSKFKTQGSAAGFPPRLRSCRGGTSARLLNLCKTGDPAQIAPTSSGCHVNHMSYGK